MKVLAYVEYDEKTGLIIGIPEKIYSRGKTIAQIDNFWNTAKRLIELERNKALIEQRERSNQYAELQRLDAMGVVTVAKMEAYVRSLNTELINTAVYETKKQIWFEKQKAKFRNLLFRLGGNILTKMIKK